MDEQYIIETETTTTGEIWGQNCHKDLLVEIVIRNHAKFFIFAILDYFSLVPRAQGLKPT